MAFAKAILCTTALISFLPWAVSEPTVKLSIPGNRKYLVVGEFAKNFLYCNTTGISQVVLCLVSIEHESFQVDYIQDPRYNFDCSKTTDVSCVLSIRSVKDIDSGTYTCADFDCGAAVQTSLHVPIYNTPLIDQLTGSTSDGTVREGQSFNLNCRVVVPAGGLPEASMQWRLDGEVVKSQNSFSDFAYSVAHANRKDSGTYSCVLLSKGSEIDSKTYPAKINVTYAAQVTSFKVFSLNHLINASGAVYAEVETSVNFECTADGNPAPFVAIRYNKDEDLVGPKLLDSVSRSLTLMKGNNYTGIYSCEAYNSENTIHAKKSIHFIVYENVKIHDFAFNDTANDTLPGCSRHVIAGNRETLQCTADGVPTPSVAILNESGAEVATGLRLASYRFSAEKNETYKCQAKTAVINSTADTKFVLCVTPRPYAAHITSFLVSSSNRLINTSGTIYAEAGTNATFDCTADGYPLPSVAIQFSRDDKEELVTQSSTFLRSVSRAVTRADGKRDTGFYICTASNSKNVSSERISLFVYVNPQIVFFALNQTNDTVTGQCSAHVTAGDKRTLQCTADGEPHPSVVILNEKGERVANGSRNAFYRFTAKNNETYECGAETAAISSTANAKFVLCVTPRPYAPRITSFFVRSPSRLINESGTIYAETGTNVTIECKADGYPVPSVAIQYSRDEELVGPKQSGSVSRISVTRADGKRDTGFYICEASNSENVSSETIHFFVYENTKIAFFALNHTNDGVNDTVTGQCKNVTSGEKQTLRCTADGNPPPSVVIRNEKGEQVAIGLVNAFYRFSAKKNETYECRAKTAVIRSTENAEFFLCVFTSTSTLSYYVWIAVAAGIVLLLVITSLIFTCSGCIKRRKKKKQRQELQRLPDIDNLNDFGEETTSSRKANNEGCN